MCPEACHVAGDENAIELFEKDLAYQVARLESVASDSRLPTSSAMRKWYIIHSRNSHVLSLLIDLMKSSPAGMTIRYSSKNAEFSLIDLNSMVIKKIASALPDFEACLNGIIESKLATAKSDNNAELSSLLSSFGLFDMDV
ncbi:hypothetical protein D3C87_1482480 [compost metagenome]